MHHHRPHHHHNHPCPTPVSDLIMADPNNLPTNVPSDPAPKATGTLPGYKFDMGHQETDRVVDELEQMMKTVRYSAGDAWMLVRSAEQIICTDLGYEDSGELEVSPCLLQAHPRE